MIIKLSQLLPLICNIVLPPTSCHSPPIRPHQRGTVSLCVIRTIITIIIIIIVVRMKVGLASFRPHSLPLAVCRSPPKSGQAQFLDKVAHVGVFVSRPTITPPRNIRLCLCPNSGSNENMILITLFFISLSDFGYFSIRAEGE